jgi:hypothetical protein
MEVCQPHSPAPLSPRKRPSGAHWIGPRVGLDAAKRKIPCGNQTPIIRSSSPYPSHYTDRTIPATLVSPISNISKYNYARGHNVSVSQGWESCNRSLLRLCWRVLRRNPKLYAFSSSRHCKHGRERERGKFTLKGN